MACELYLIFLNRKRGLPWWSSGCESTCQCRKHRFDPWSRKILHATGQLDLCPQLPSQWSRAPDTQLLSSTAATTEARVPKAHFSKRSSLQQEKPLHGEEHGHHNQRVAPLTATRESLCAAMKTQHTQKYMNKSFKKQEKSPPRILYFNCFYFPLFFPPVTDHTHICEYTFNSLCYQSKIIF